SWERVQSLLIKTGLEVQKDSRGCVAQKFAEYTHKSPRAHSLVLSHPFSDTSVHGNFIQPQWIPCMSWVASGKSQVIPVTILDLFDHRAFASEAKEECTNYMLRPGSLS
ncbi:hypothetical protein E2I00_014017, partial [Balaenoptera physalus]